MKTILRAIKRFFARCRCKDTGYNSLGHPCCDCNAYFEKVMKPYWARQKSEKFK